MVIILDKKTKFALEEGMGGVMIWELGKDLGPEDEMALLRAVRGVLDNKKDEL